jgi:hypothetical protein
VENVTEPDRRLVVAYVLRISLIKSQATLMRCYLHQAFELSFNSLMQWFLDMLPVDDTLGKLQCGTMPDSDALCMPQQALLKYAPTFATTFL